MQIGAENKDGETLMENILDEAFHDILESEELDKLLDDCEKKPVSLHGPTIDDEESPSCKLLNTEFE